MDTTSPGLESANRSLLPIVDISPFVDGGAEPAKRAMADELVAACKEIGFVYVKGYGLPKDDLDQAFRISKRFYDMPTSEKMKAPHSPGWAVHRGYSWPGLEKVSNATSEDDSEELAAQLREVQDLSYEVGSEQNPDMPNVWPPDDVFPEWRPFMTSFYWTCWKTARVILQALALGLGIDEDLIMKPHGGHHNQLRLLHYPSVPASWVDEGKFARMPAHTDWTTITTLFQDDCGGLQVESPSQPGQFIDVDPIPDTLVLNVGDLMTRWSNDYLKSTQHRVQLPRLQDRHEGEQRMTRQRYSIPYFVAIECLRLHDGQPPKYEPITQREYAAMRARMQY